ncbi:DUF1064 domain-containing protein [Enterococcus pallens]|uniref:DUF1064 domain-containing protein n=1 Tax=Enterococcus pallens ATCC BAA-351 TaxID=1158607 RepID=R2SEW4_9ENTE|nr:DUF1064 domain-containing protein [Enterococcus pallens]EOH86729.1 hypothetical protein UAU_05175 [Enterococcus pallens ATCC BAA-351]EOU18525.1 hypothetical protein I588_03520 [Enterococcus pallens ATCC BAA-351]OJG76543.1 hypothetical protein RV10_GL003680 [Enterococcus pallens]
MRYPKRKSKYGNKKVYRYGRWFDSIAEAEYYPIAVKYASDEGCELRLQERLDILPTLKLNQWAIRKSQYVADYAFYYRGKLVRLVDVKGVETSDFRLKAKLIAKEYGVVIQLAKKKRNGFVHFPFNMPTNKRKEVTR